MSDKKNQLNIMQKNASWDELITHAMSLVTADTRQFFSDYKPLLCAHLDHFATRQLPLDYHLLFIKAWAVKQPIGRPEIGLMPASSITKMMIESGLDDFVTCHVYDNQKAGEILCGHVVRDPKAIAKDDVSVFITSISYEKEISNQLLSLGCSEEKIFNFTDPRKLDVVNDIEYQKATAIAQEINEAEGQKIIISAITFPFANMDRIKALKKTGKFKIFLLSCSEYMANGPKLSEYNDVVFEKIMIIGLKKILTVLASLKGDITMLTSTHICLSNPMFLMMNCFFNGQQHIHEVYDTVDELVHIKQYPIYKRHEDIIKNLGAEVWALDHHAKKLLYAKVDKILYRDSPRIFKALTKAYQMTKPSMHTLPFPAYQHLDNPKISQNTGSVHFVHCGNIVPRDGKSNTEVNTHDSLFDSVSRIICQEIHLHIYNPLDFTGVMRDQFFQGTDEKYKRFFHYEKPLFGTALFNVINQYDYGWMVYDFKHYSKNEMPSHFHTLSSKLFTYIQAELPIIISAEYEYMASFVAEYQIGFVTQYDAIDSLNTIMARASYETLKKNVISAKKELCLESNIEAFSAFLLS